MMKKVLLVAALTGMGLFVLANQSWAQAPGECTGGACGTPNQSGGGGGGGGGSILVNNTDLGDTYQYADDNDSDGWEDDADNCPFAANLEQLDSDGDGIGDSCDLCPNIGDQAQIDTDGDGIGDLCDSDMDNDGLLNAGDNCGLVSNPQQRDTDVDGIGDACDLDDDADGVNDIIDNCPLVANPLQENTDPNLFGDKCDDDLDLDNISDSKDNCPSMSNQDQVDADENGMGDACDPDIDGDEITNIKDNCLMVVNKEQRDDDRDGAGNACDSDYCYVVEGDQENCLDPQRAFQVYSPSMNLKTGEEARLRLFANRTSTAIRYTWVVVQKPAGSTATVSNSRGTVRLSSPYEYFYLKNNVATFTPDLPGTYTIKVTGELVFPDVVNPDFPRTHSYETQVIAEGEPISSGGCSMGSNANAGTLFIMLALLGLVWARRRS